MLLLHKMCAVIEWSLNSLVLLFNIFFCSLKPISSTWYDYWGTDYGTYNYNPYIGGVGIQMPKPPPASEKNGSQSISVSVSQGTYVLCIISLAF